MKIEVGGELNCAGFTLSLTENKKTRRFAIKYPTPIWRALPQENRRLLLDNFSFVTTCHLPLQKKSITEIAYCNRRPENFNSYLNNLFYTIPFDAFMNGQGSFGLYQRLLKIRFTFSGSSPSLHSPRRALRQLSLRKAVIPFTFGKDSLLTFALARELGIKTRLVFIEEPRELYAAAHKKERLEKFTREFGVKVDFLPNAAGVLRDVSEGNNWFGWELLLTSFALLLLPYLHYEQAKYLLFANEASCNEITHNGEGIYFYPAFEQSDLWTEEETQIVQNVSGQCFAVRSLLGPLNDLAIIKILHRRYPSLSKYQLSCFADRKEARHKAWCAACSKCARSYIFLLASGIDPKTVGFKDEMLEVKYQKLYSLFDDGNGKEGYDATSVGRDEQLFAFFLAWQHGIRDGLMKVFEKDYLTEALKKEKSLRQKYFSLQPSNVLPEEYKNKIMSIYRHELNSF